MDRYGSLGFRGIHPLASGLYFALWAVMLTLGFHLGIAAAAFLAAVLLAAVLGLKSSLRRNAKWYALTILLTAVIHPLLNHRGRTILFYFLDQPITLEAVLYGLQTAVMISGVMCLFLSFNEVIHPGRFLYLFSKLSPKAALLMMMALRFVPLCAARLRLIGDVQRTRRETPQGASFADRMRRLGARVQILVTWSLESAVATADSMAARGYAIGPRTSYRLYRFGLRDGIFVGISGALFLMCISLWLAGWGRMDVENGPIWDARDGVVLAGVLAFAAIPIAMEGRERWWWRSTSLKSKNSASAIRTSRT
jgi:energy-coupling factor transport system permease protein